MPNVFLECPLLMQVTDFATGSIQLRLKILNRRPPAPRRRLPPDSAGGRNFRQAKSRLSLRPNSLAMTAADLPLDNQLRTTSHLNDLSNFRRVLVGESLIMDSMVQDIS
jgi:hypothetical protein